MAVIACGFCGEREATLHLKQVTDGAIRELHLCAECAQRHGFEEGAPTSLADFLGGLEAAQARREPPRTTCAGCGMTDADYRGNSLLGCATCYETFREELAPVLEDMQAGPVHTGKAPAAEAKRAELALLESRLAEAVAAQDFESAAVLRDEIRRQKAEA